MMKRKEMAQSDDGGRALLVTQKEAASLLKVGESYLRNSDCPKILLAGNGPKGKNLVRYRMADLEAWAQSRRVASMHNPEKRA